MAQNYAQEYLKKLDERWTTEAKTELIVNNGDLRFEFVGTNSVVVYNVDTVPENDYVRAGSNRFGALVELGTGIDTYTLSQDKAFTFTVDRGNLNDSMMAQDVAKAVKRQVREVSVPTTDIYRLSVLAAYAIANSQGSIATAAATNTTAYQLLLAQQAELDDAEVPEENRVAFVTPQFHNLLKRDPEFVRDCDKTYADLKKGVIGQVDGLMLVKCPSSYYVSNFEFMIVHKDVTIAPTKFNSVRTLDDVQGIDGWVAEGRRYYDAFVRAAKGTGVRIKTHS